MALDLAHLGGRGGSNGGWEGEVEGFVGPVGGRAPLVAVHCSVAGRALVSTCRSSVNSVPTRLSIKGMWMCPGRQQPSV
jgi:hypothetical protein